MNHEVTLSIDAPADIVWSVLTDVARWPEWNQSVRTVDLLDDTLAVGHRVRIRQPKFPAVTWTVTDIEPDASFTWRSRSPGADAIGRHRVIENGDGTSTVVLGITQRGVLGTLVGVASRRTTKRYVALEATGLKARSEAEVERIS